ncbi:MAG TPA: hypothetical protein DEO94_00175 [Cyanobacteria bacterium UBA11991]|nr:hypothetical protein [Cyanobacteriota bacterium]MDY6358394.1 hypothetical protein [Cyanobacteriota bacterium]MDY6363301.1 hypothetical protein [Cyanobacteriota bacterium]MDY6383709.1 hypothetical protein [Cyanobacteriota bacterium]HCB10586.1 hypothetical protein [Cyanobacteria bacterium UBA11991]
MNIQAVNNYNQPNFGARIKINKAVKEDLLTGGLASGIGSTASAAGVLSATPMSDPAHHVQAAAKVIDAVAASTGAGLSVGGASAWRLAVSFFKSAVNKITGKIPS